MFRTATRTHDNCPVCDLLFEREPGARAFGKARDGLLVLVPQDEFDLPELVRLKSAGGLQPLAKRQELARRHRLEDVELRDEHLEDRQDSLERVLRTMRLARAQQPRHVIELVQELLEPELVHLVDHDEEHLVMLGALGARLLKREELVDLEIAGVGHRRVGAGGIAHGVPSDPTSSPTERISASALLRVTGPGFIR